MSISKSEVSKYRTVNDCETRRRQPLALVFKALWAKWWRRQSDQICRWISQGFYSKYRFTIIVSQAFLYHSSMCSYLTDSKILLWWTKILPYDKIFNKCLMTPPNVLNVSNYFNSMIYKIWYWQINILWYSKYKIRKFREISSQLCKVEERSSVVCEGGSLTGVILKAPSTPLWWINTCYLFTKFQLHILKNLRWVYLYKNIQRNLINLMLLPCYCQFLYIVFSLHIYSEHIWFMKL